MYDFFMTALPFIVIGLCLAILSANKKDKKEENYLAEGMSLGMCIGVTFATTMNFDVGLGISLGMLIGETVGYLIKKK